MYINIHHCISAYKCLSHHHDDLCRALFTHPIFSSSCTMLHTKHVCLTFCLIHSIYTNMCKFILYLDTTYFACTIIYITWVIMWSSCWVNRHGLSSRVLSIMALYYGANIKVRVKNQNWADWLNLQKKTRHTCFSTYF